MIPFHDPLGGIQHLGSGLGVQRCGMLIQQKQLGLLQRGHQQGQSLALSTGEQANLCGKAVLQPQVQGLQQLTILLNLILGYAPAQAALFAPAGCQSQILHDLHIGCGAGHGVLEHTAKHGCPLILAQAGDIHAVDEDRAGVHGPDARHGIHHGGLTCAIAADDGAEIAVVEGQADTLKGFLFIDGTGIEGLINIADFQHVTCPPFPFWHSALQFGQRNSCLHCADWESPGRWQPQWR